MKNDLLELPTRKLIFDFIRLNPGVYFREVLRNIDISNGQLVYHLDEMIKAEIIVKETESGNARYYIRDRFSRNERKALSIMRKDISRSIILYLVEYPGSTPTDILKDFSFTKANLSYHLRRLERLDLVRVEKQGREKRYFITDPDLIRDLLIVYKTTIFDKIVDTISYRPL